MRTVLVTGATGTLGTPIRAKLRAAGNGVRALSRMSGSGLRPATCSPGEGIPAAMSGADTVVHLAKGSRDLDRAKAGIDASNAADLGHLVLIPIVENENIPLGYYKGKVQVEKYLEGSGVLFTIRDRNTFADRTCVMRSIRCGGARHRSSSESWGRDVAWAAAQG